MRSAKTDCGERLGLVLSGGGAKGAFQIGVWQAMCELGLASRITAISGTSVGAINGGVIAAGNDIGKMKRLWGQAINDVRSTDFVKLLDQLPVLANGAISFFSGKNFQLPALLNYSWIESILRELMPVRWPVNAPALYVTSLKVPGNCVGNNDAKFSLTRFNIGDTMGLRQRVDRILASAAIPWGFPAVKIDGDCYVDGGWTEKGGDNVPVAPILQRHPEIKTIFVVRCNSADIDKMAIKKPRGVDIVEIRPEKALRGIFDTYLEHPLIDLASLVSDLVIPVLSISERRNILRIWSGALAFDREYTEQYMEAGYYAAKKRLRSYLIHSARLDF